MQLSKIITIILKIFSKIIKQNDKFIIFESFHGKNFSDNPKSIYIYLIKQKQNFKYIWVVEDLSITIPGEAIKVKKNSLKYLYYLYRSKYWIFNSRISDIFPKKKGNIYLQTWHGIPLKKLGFDINEYKGPKNKNYKLKLKKCVERWDYLLSPNAYSTCIFRSCFNYSKDVLEYGYPRSEKLLVNNNIEEIFKIKEKLKLKTNKKIILYTPTFRDDEYKSDNKNSFQIKMDLSEMKKKLDNQYIVLLRFHYNIVHVNIDEFEGFVYNFSKYDDINDLYLISDILITDYSSTMFDYLLLNRPILFYTYDLEKYRDKLRGFYFDFEEEAPGPLLNNTSDLIKNILEIDNIKIIYDKKYKKFQKKYCDVVSEITTKIIVEEILHK